jgi:hypothetical protein
MQEITVIDVFELSNPWITVLEEVSNLKVSIALLKGQASAKANLVSFQDINALLRIEEVLKKKGERSLSEMFVIIENWVKLLF